MDVISSKAIPAAPIISQNPSVGPVSQGDSTCSVVSQLSLIFAFVEDCWVLVKGVEDLRDKVLKLLPPFEAACTGRYVNNTFVLWGPRGNSRCVQGDATCHETGASVCVARLPSNRLSRHRFRTFLAECFALLFHCGYRYLQVKTPLPGVCRARIFRRPLEPARLFYPGLEPSLKYH